MSGFLETGSAKHLKSTLSTEKTKPLHTIARIEKALKGVNKSLTAGLVLPGDIINDDIDALLGINIYGFLNDSEKVELLCPILSQTFCF